MADNASQQGNDTIRTVDRSGVETQVVGVDIAQSGESERLGLPPATLITVTAAGLSTGAAYASGDVLGTEIEFANAARYTGGGLQVVSAVLIDRADVLGAADLFLFDRASTPAADNAAATWADADMANALGVINFGALLDAGANRIGVAVGGLPLIAKPNATSIFGVLVTRSTNTQFGAATDLIVKLGVIRD